MLSITIPENHSFYMPEVCISVLDIDRSRMKVRVGIVAPNHLPVLRGNVLTRGYSHSAMRHATEEQFEKMAELQRRVRFGYPRLLS